MKSRSRPTQMKFVHFDHPGSPNVMTVRTGTCPTPTDNEVLIEVFAAGVNRPDILQRQGHYPPPKGASPILGLEVSGRIAAHGAHVKHLKVGDAVCALTSGGGYAEYCVVPATQCLLLPQNISFEEAAGIPETFFTVWSNVFLRGKLKSNETFLVHGGSSGIGTTAIQLACAFGARALATAGSDDKCSACMKLGAYRAVNYKTHDFVSEFMAATHKKGVDVILDMVGGDYFAKNLELLSTEGRLVQIAYQKGHDVELSLRTLLTKRLSIMGSTLRPQSAELKSYIAQDLHEHVWPLLEARKVQVVIDSVYPLENVSMAHHRLESNEHIGKVILQIRAE